MNKIKSIFNKIWKNKFLPYIIIIMLGILICMPLFRMTLNKYNEFRIHIGRVVSIREVLKDGIFPPYISYKHMNNFGYALNIFYGVLTTYIPILISLITGSCILALKLFTILVVILSGITMYKFAYEITNRKLPSLITALVYMAAPYKFCDIYSRNAVGEYTAFVFIPMVFQGIYQLLNDNKKGNYYLVIGASLLVLSHTITTIYTVIFAILFLLFNFKKLKNKTVWKYFIIDGLLIIILTAFYMVPILEHKMAAKYVIYDEDRMGTSGVYVYTDENTNNPLQWFMLETRTGLNFSFGVVITILIISTIFTYKHLDKKLKDIYGTCWILSIISLIMCTKIFPWMIMPQFLTIIQFAWRINGFFILFISIVCGINAWILTEKVLKNDYAIPIFIIITIFIMSGISGFNYATKNYSRESEDKFEEKIIDASSIGPFNINRDYMPLRALDNIQYLQQRKNISILMDGNAIIENESKNKLHDEFEVSKVNNAKIELPYLYYCGYTVKLNGKEIKNHESKNGFVEVEINENGKIEVDYTGTKIEKAGMIISALGLIGCMGYLLANKKKAT